jgi:hypothetical protein
MKKKFTMAGGARLAVVLACCFNAVGHAQEPAEHQVPPGNWNDTFVGIRYADDLYFPGSVSKVAQKIGTLTTTGAFKYGSYVFNVEYLVSDKNNPVAGGTSGAQEIYSVGRVEWSAGKILGHPVGAGVVRDVGFTTGYEFSAKNDVFGSRARMLILGPNVRFAVPRGYWNATLGWRTETNHNGITHADVHYSTAWHADSSWLIPFSTGPVPTVFKGFTSITGPKGLDGFHAQTQTEVLLRASVLFDVGALAGSPRTFYLGPGYEYWHNMFGDPPGKGTRRSAPALVGEIHF